MAYTVTCSANKDGVRVSISSSVHSFACPDHDPVVKVLFNQLVWRFGNDIDERRVTIEYDAPNSPYSKQK